MNKQIKWINKLNQVPVRKGKQGMQEDSSIAEASFTFSHKTSTTLTETHYMTSYNKEGKGEGKMSYNMQVICKSKENQDSTIL